MVAYCLMKTDIHPAFFEKSETRCSCGAIYHIPSTKEKIQIEICRACHPFYTGTDKVMDVAGRVERFKTRAGKKVETKIEKKTESRKQKAVKKPGK